MTVMDDVSIDAFGARLLGALEAADPAKLFCVFGGEGGELHYGELAQRVAACAARLQARGVGPGVRVVIKLPLGAEAIVHLLATMAAGGMAVPLEKAASDGGEASPMFPRIDSARAWSRPSPSPRAPCCMTTACPRLPVGRS